MTHRRSRRVACPFRCASAFRIPALLLALTVLPCPLNAQPPADTATTEPETAALPPAADVRRQLEGLTGTDPETVALRQRLESLLGELEQLEQARQREAQYTQQRVEVAEEIRRTRESLERLQARPPQPPPDAPLTELRQQYAELTGQLDAQLKALQELEQEPARQRARRKAIAEELAAGSAAQESLAVALQDDEVLSDANQRAVLLARLAALRGRQQALEAEQAWYDAAVDLLPLREQLAAATLEETRHQLAQMAEAIDQRARAETEQQLREARDRASQVEGDSQAQELFHQSARLASQRRQVQAQLNSVRSRLLRTREALADFRLQERAAQEQVRDVGLTNALGQLLRTQRAELATGTAEIRQQLPQVQADLLEAQAEMLKYQEERRRLAQESSPLASSRIAREAAGMRLELIVALAGDYRELFYGLINLDSALRTELAEKASYIRFIDENILWVKGAAWPRRSDSVQLVAALRWLADPGPWRAAAEGLLADARRHPLLTAGFGIAIVLLILAARPLSRRVIAIGEEAQRGSAQRFTPTLTAFALTLLAAVPWPLLVGYLGWRLQMSATDPGLPRWVGESLWKVAWLYFLLVWVRQTFRARGLAGSHFGWTVTDLAPVRRWLRHFMLLVLPGTFLVVLMNVQPNLLYRFTLGRFTLVVVLLLIAALAHRLLRPRGILEQVTVLAQRPNWRRLRYLVYAIGVGVPVALALLSIGGYLMAAIRLSERGVVTLWFLFLLLLLGSLLLRWALVTRRGLAIQQRLRLRRQDVVVPVTAPLDLRRVTGELPPVPDRDADATGEPGEDDDAAGGERAVPLAEPEVDLAAVTRQTRRFLLSALIGIGVFGLWAIWKDVVPAAGVLNEVELWKSAVATVEVPVAPGTSLTAPTAATSATPVAPIVEWVTLADLLWAIVIAVVAVGAARNIPGLLEMSFFQRLALDAAIRFTLSAVARYAIYAVAILVICNILGFAWSRVTWLVAALTVGLGFGLQEIFANFVSGLIVLVERPVRVGDLVTIGTVSGTVTRIQMRATTIQDWNRRELIVPNKELVTGQLINWTLTDSTYRVDLAIGVAYRTDVTKALEILLEIAQDNPTILEKPKPKAIFRSFGDSALQLELRIFIPHMDYWPRVVTEVNTAIDARFREAGIEIAYPQQDIHIRTIESALPDRADGKRDASGTEAEGGGGEAERGGGEAEGEGGATRRGG